MPEPAWRRVARVLVPRSVRPGVLVPRLRGWVHPVRLKRSTELNFWRGVFAHHGGPPANAYFAALFGEPFGLSSDFFAGKRMLDVGCGPAGSLEWATMAVERVGLDPLVPKYRSLGINERKMRYVEARAEQMPFPDEYFDVVSSLNSLDHVEDVQRTIAEMIRVLRVGGSMLLLVEINHPPTVTEPVTLPWELPSWFEPSMRTVLERRYEMSGADAWFYASVFADRRWNHTCREPRSGLLLARLEKIARIDAVGGGRDEGARPGSCSDRRSA